MAGSNRGGWSKWHQQGISTAWIGWFVAATIGYAAPESEGPILHRVEPPVLPVGQTQTVRLVGEHLADCQLLFSRPGIRSVVTPNGVLELTVSKEMLVGPLDVWATNAEGISNPRSLWISSHPVCVEVEPNDRLDQAQPVEGPIQVVGVIDRRADTDTFALPLQQGQRILFVCRASQLDSKLDAVLTVFQPNGQQMARALRTGTLDPVIELTAPVAGIYTIQITDVTFVGGPQFHYALAIHQGPYLAEIYPRAVVPGLANPLALVFKPEPHSEWTAQSELEKRETPLTPPEKGTPESAFPFLPIGWQWRREVLEPPAAAAQRAAAQPGNWPFLLAPQAWLDLWVQPIPSIPDLPPTWFAVVPTPVQFESEPNDTASSAQELTLPQTVVGRFDHSRDRDFYRFNAQQGDQWLIQLYSERLGVLSDLSVLILQEKPLAVDATNAASTANSENQRWQVILPEQDDWRENVGGDRFRTSTHDPQFLFDVPQTGTYWIQVRDRYTFHRHAVGASQRSYLLRLRPPTQDFRLVQLPDDPIGLIPPIVPASGRALIRIIALRDPGMNLPILIRATATPPGLPPVATVLGSQQNEALLVLHATDDALPALRNHWLQVSGQAVTPTALATLLERGPAALVDAELSESIGTPVIAYSGTTIFADLPPAEQSARLSRGFPVAVRGTSHYELTAAPFWQIVAFPAVLPVQLQFQKVPTQAAINKTASPETNTVSDSALATNLQIYPLNLPTNSTFTPIQNSPATNCVDALLYINHGITPGDYSLNFAGQRQTQGGASDPKTPVRDPAILYSAPLFFRVLPTQLAIQAPARLELTAGNRQRLACRIQAVGKYRGPVRLELYQPPSLAGQGVRAETVLGHTDRLDWELEIQAAADAVPGLREHIYLRASIWQPIEPVRANPADGNIADSEQTNAKMLSVTPITTPVIEAIGPGRWIPTDIPLAIEVK